MLPGSQSLSFVATELGYSVVHFNDEANKVLSYSSAFLVVSKTAIADNYGFKTVADRKVVRVKFR